MMTYMDKIVAKIIAEVKTQGLEKNTLILFIGDNGTHKSIVSKWNNTQRRGGKGMTTNAGTHVPFYACWPGEIAPNSKSDAIVCLSDFQITLLDLASEPLHPLLNDDSLSFSSILRGNEIIQREFIYVYYNPRPTNPNRKKFAEVSFVRDQRYKLYSDSRFYDVENDLLEQHNIPAGGAKDKPVIRQKFQAKLEKMPQTGQNLINK